MGVSENPAGLPPKSTESVAYPASPALPVPGSPGWLGIDAALQGELQVSKKIRSHWSTVSYSLVRSYSSGHLYPFIYCSSYIYIYMYGCKRDYTFHKWGYKL